MTRSRIAGCPMLRRPTRGPAVTRAFEQPATIALPDDALGAGAALEGLFLPVPTLPECGGGLVAAPHPLMGGSMDSPVATELAFALEQAGLASLRFNWRGVGGSAGSPSGDEAAASGDAWPIERPEVPPEKRPSVSSAQALPRPLDLM